MTTEANDLRISELMQAIEQNPAVAEPHVQLGYAQFEAEAYEAASAAFQAALAIDPAAAAAHNGLGRIYERRGEAAAALAAYEAAIALNTMGIPPHIGRGIVYLDLLGDYAAAEQAFLAGLAIQSDDSFALALLGNTYAYSGRFEDAIQALQQSANLQPDNPFALSNLSLVYLHLHRYEAVIDSCQREIAIRDDAEPRRLLGYTLARLDRPQEASKQLARAVALKPDDYEARGALARVYHTLGRPDEAAEHYAVASAQAAADNEYGRACFAAVTGDHDTAFALLEFALSQGQVRPAWVRIDPEFAFLQAEARFQALLNG